MQMAFRKTKFAFQKPNYGKIVVGFFKNFSPRPEDAGQTQKIHLKEKDWR